MPVKLDYYVNATNDSTGEITMQGFYSLFQRRFRVELELFRKHPVTDEIDNLCIPFNKGILPLCFFETKIHSIYIERTIFMKT